MSLSGDVSFGIRFVGYVDDAFILVSMDAYPFPVKRQDVFGGIGQPESLIDRVVDIDKAAESYRAFEKGEVGKTIFDPWK